MECHSRNNCNSVSFDFKLVAFQRRILVGIFDGLVIKFPDDLDSGFDSVYIAFAWNPAFLGINPGRSISERQVGR